MGMKNRAYLAMDLDRLIEEHKKLVKDLESADEKVLKDELTEQKKELEHYIDLRRQHTHSAEEVFSVLVQKVNPKTHRREWALLSKNKDKVLKWFGVQKPSEETVKKEEKRVQFWKSRSHLYPTLSRLMSEVY
jgi:hypothetical protein